MKQSDAIQGPGRFRWQVLEAALRPGERRALEALIERWPELPGRSGAEIFKENYQRTVFALGADPPGGEEGRSREGKGAAGRWVLKKYRHGGFYDRCRYRIISSRAEREFRALRKLREWGFPVPRPLAYGLRRERGSPVEGGLVMEEIPGTILLSEFLAGAHGEAGRNDAGGPSRLPGEARRLLTEAGRLARRLHDRGVFHPDLHSANFLVDPGGGLHLIDLHSCLFPGFMPRWIRHRHLAKVAHSLAEILPDSEWRWFLAGYLGGPAGSAASAPEGSAIARLEIRLRRGLDRLERRRLRSRTRRCIRRSTVFTVGLERGKRVYRRRSLPRAVLDALLEPPAGEGNGALRAWTLPGPDGSAPLAVRHERYRLVRRLASLIAAHPLRRAWIASHGLAVRGIAAPAALALVEERRLGLVSRAWLIQEPLTAGRPLDRWLREEEGNQAAGSRRRLAIEIGRLLRQAHNRGVRMQGLSPGDMMVLPAGPAEPPAMLLAAIESITFRDHLGHRRRRRDLERLGGLCGALASSAERLRALRAYDGGGGSYYRADSIRRLRDGALREMFAAIGRLTWRELAPEAGRLGAVRGSGTETGKD